MLTAPPAHYQRRTHATLIAWCAAASLGLLFLKTNQLAYLSVSYGRQNVGMPDYLPLVATIGGLVAWHLAPRRAWAWLLLAGGVCTVPGAVLGVVPGLYDRSMFDVMMVLWSSGPALTLVGLLGAATVVWQAGARTAGAALVGTAMVIQLVGPVVIVAAALDRSVSAILPQRLLAWAIVVFAVVALVGAVAALVVARPGEPPRPRWRVTAAGGVAAVTQVLLLVWQPTGRGPHPDYLLQVGLVLLAVGLAIAATAGREALLGAVAAGLMLGALSMLIAPSADVLREIPLLAALAAVVSTAAGFGAALLRRRTQIGIGGLLVVVVGLVVIYALFASDLEVASYREFTFAATPVLMVIGVVAAVCAMASAGDTLAGRSATPAVLVGAVTPLTLGTIAVIAHFMATRPANTPQLTGLLPPAAGALLLATLILVASARLARLHELSAGESAV